MLTLEPFMLTLGKEGSPRSCGGSFLISGVFYAKPEATELILELYK
jgi:hypothetical protein